jgi:hypothetical protein
MGINLPDIYRNSLLKKAGTIYNVLKITGCLLFSRTGTDSHVKTRSFSAFYMIAIIILTVNLTACRTWEMLTKKFSSLYTEKEKIILAETTESINFKYGYDPDLDIDYVYKAGQYTEKDINAGLPVMKKILLKYPKEEVIVFYEKIISLKETQVWKMNRFMEKKRWTNYTYLQKYILPETEQYLALLEKNILQLDDQYKETIETRKEEIKKETEENLLKKQEAHEKKLREERKPSWR